jgi:hypothetical protein
MNRAQYLRINTEKVSYETIDGETLIINLENGNYYSLLGTGAEVWSIVERGAAIGDIVEAIDRRYSGNRTDVEAAVTRFAAELQREGLIAHDDGPGLEGTPVPDLRTPTNGDEERRPFEAPVLSKYTDMQDLLLLDPIHEVDETGWPSPKAPRED